MSFSRISGVSWILAIWIVGVSACVAVPGYDGPPYVFRGALPTGSYSDTCRNIRVTGHYLDAECQRRDGQWNSTHLDLNDCDRGIVNDDGRLACSQSQITRLPPGSYQQSCQDAKVEGRYLIANCRTRSGEVRSTHLDLTRCYRPIGNDDGRLVCGF